MIARKGFLREHHSVVLFFLMVFDQAILFLTGVLTYYLIYHSFPEALFYKSLIIINGVSFLVLARNVRLYSSKRGRNYSSDFLYLSGIWVLLTAILFICSAFLDYERLFNQQGIVFWILSWGAVATTCLLASRGIMRTGLKLCRRFGFNQRKIVLVGANRNAMDVEKKIHRSPEHGLQIVGYLDDRSSHRGNVVMESRYLGKTDTIFDFIAKNDVDQVWITYPLIAEERTKQFIEKLSYETTSVRYVIDTLAFKGNIKTITNISDIPLLDIDISPMDEYVNLGLKRVEDFIGALVALLILSPLFLLIAIGVKLSSPGPVFFRQTRISWKKEPFEILKFRSMPVDAEQHSGPKWASGVDNRATNFGVFLRKTSLDELPQFINVLKGEMSIVGPRPERPEFVDEFKKSVPDYMKKHMVKAGITGWAQVNGYRGNTDLKKRIEYDIDYIKHWSLLFDIQIAFLTFYKGFIHKNAY